MRISLSFDLLSWNSLWCSLVGRLLGFGFDLELLDLCSQGFVLTHHLLDRKFQEELVCIFDLAETVGLVAPLRLDKHFKRL